MNLDLVEELFFFLVIFIIGIWLIYDGLITLNGTKKQILSFVYYLYLPVIGIIFGQAQKEKYLTTFTTPFWRRLLGFSAISAGIEALLLVVLRIFNI
jgi:hypothetical protein